LRHIVNALFLQQRMVLLARRNPRRKTYPGLWSFPGGHAEPGETMREALFRDLREEVGVTPTRTSYLTSIRDPNAVADDSATYHIYAVTCWIGGEPHLVGDEHTELRWFPVDEAAHSPDLALREYQALFRAVGIRRS
jgi:8-oxo-dGTP diphosphatase